MQQTENDILKRVRKIEIKTRGLSNEIFAGKYHTAFRGRGMSFSEVREYRAGDDVRDIDWNVTARSRKPHIKIYEEERELTMMLLVDVSASRMFGSTGPPEEEHHHRNRRRAGLLGRAEQRQGGLHLLLGQGREVHPPEEGAQPHPDDHPRAGGLPARIDRHEAFGAGAVPDQRQQETLHDLHPLGLHGLVEGQGRAGRRAEDRRGQARSGGHPRIRSPRDGAARRGHRRAEGRRERPQGMGRHLVAGRAGRTTPGRGSDAAPRSTRRSSTTASIRR